MALTKKQRDALPAESFAVPDKRRLPISDEKHTRLAWTQVDHTDDLTDEERDEARDRIRKRANELGIDTSGWKASALGLDVVLQAMSLNVPHTPGHPNKLPFKGILTRIDEPSDAAPDGSNGKRVLLTRAAAEEALPTLLGMPVDLKTNMAGHDVKSKVGTITAATIEGNAIHIEGFLFAADFPDEVRRIQSERNDLGFSWEIQNIFVEDIHADPLVMTGCTFTGAAILYKDKAAYTTTSLAAQAEEKFMTKEVLEAIADLGNKVGSMSERMEKFEASQAETTKQMQAGKEHMAKVEPHAAALEKVADDMEKDGVGGHTRMGHVKACRAMADHLRASAATGKLADMWPGYDGFHASAAPAENAEAKALLDQMQAQAADSKTLKDEIASLKTTIIDLKANATRTTAAPERKTLSPHIMALLARGNIALPEGEKKLSVADVNGVLGKSSLDPEQRMEIKAQLEKAGLLSA